MAYMGNLDKKVEHKRVNRKIPHNSLSVINVYSERLEFLQNSDLDSGSAGTPEVV